MNAIFDLGDIIYNGILNFFQGLLDGGLKIINSSYTMIMENAGLFLQNELIQQGILYGQILALTILAIKVMFEGFTTYVMYQSGDPESDPVGLLVRTGQAVAIIGFLPELLKWMFNFGTTVARDVGGIVGVDIDGVNLLPNLMPTMEKYIGAEEVIAEPNMLLSVVIAGIIILVFLSIIIIQASIRGAELALMALMGSFLALNLTQNNRGTWESYIKKVIVLCLTQGLQIFMLQLTFVLITLAYGSTGGSILAMIGWLWVTLKTPNYLKEFVHSTGFGGTIGGGARTVGNSLMMRKAMPFPKSK